MNRTERNFWLDLTIFMAFLITTLTALFLWLVIPHEIDIVFLGFSRHVWGAAHIFSGMVGLAGIVMHIVWHWDWLKALRGRPIRMMPEKLRLNRVVDRAVWFIFIATNVFGSVAWAFHLGDDIYAVSLADRLHAGTALVCLVLMIVHLALHWKWIVSNTRRCLPLLAAGR